MRCTFLYLSSASTVSVFSLSANGQLTFPRRVVIRRLPIVAYGVSAGATRSGVNGAREHGTIDRARGHCHFFSTSRFSTSRFL